jgi:hydroxymethylglutaryl-CoA synthase
VFNGKYSTTCYLDEVVAALDRMFTSVPRTRRGDFYAELAGLFFHRPYHHLPITALATAMSFDLARDPDARPQLHALAAEAGVEVEAVIAEVERHSAAEFDLFAEVQARGPGYDPFPSIAAVAKHVRASTWFAEFTAEKLGLGAELVRDVGNLYTASLPAWLAAGFEDALMRGLELGGRRFLLVGYGSGDAAEAIPATVVPGWERAAATIGFAEALADACDLEREQYEALHDGRTIEGLAGHTQGFAIQEVGALNDEAFADIGVEYYRYSAAPC